MPLGRQYDVLPRSRFEVLPYCIPSSPDIASACLDLQFWFSKLPWRRATAANQLTLSGKHPRGCDLSLVDRQRRRLYSPVADPVEPKPSADDVHRFGPRSSHDYAADLR